MKLGSILTVVTIATVSVAGAGIAGAFNKEENKSLGEEKKTTQLEIGEQGKLGDSDDGEEESKEEEEEGDKEKLRVCPSEDSSRPLEEDQNTCILSTSDEH